MKPLKIAFLMTQSLESPSGIGRYGPLARELARIGHKVEIFALHPDFGSLKSKSFEDQGVHVEYVAAMHVRKQANLKSYYGPLSLIKVAFLATIRLCRAAFSSSADIFFICKPHPMNGMAGLLAGKTKRKPVIVDCDDYEAGSGNFANKWQKMIVALFEKRVPTYARAVFTNTEFMRQNLISWGVPSENIQYLPNGVERTRFEGADKLESVVLADQLGLKGKKTISFIGSLSLANHPVNLLVEAFVHVIQQLPDARLLIVGGGEDYDRLVEQVKGEGISDAVIFTGRIPPDQIPHYYRLSHVSVDPIYDDDAARGRSPLKMFESWACGVPFITSDVGDRQVLSGDPPACLFIKPGDPASMAEAIIRIMINPETAESLAHFGSIKVQEYFWDRLVKFVEFNIF